MPNTLAYSALIAWPFVTLLIFIKFSPPKALIWSVLAGYLLLPVKTGFDFPGVPALDKTSVANISAMIGAMIFHKGPVMRPPREWWLVSLIAIYVGSPMATVMTNRDPLMFGAVLLPGLTPYDAFSAAAYRLIDLIPFLAGYNMLRRSKGHYALLRTLAVGALAYSLLMLVEIRLSPQLHAWVYGFFPHSFEQQVRDGAFRPVVFLGHGLEVAIFTAMAIVAMASLAQRRERIFGVSATLWITYLVGILIVCRSLGALILGVSALAILVSVKKRAIFLLCAIFALTVLVYPILRGADLIPVVALSEQVAAFNEKRAASFQMRVDNEDALLARANERPWFGWGGYGRNRIFDESDGKDLSVTDGTWIITVGTHGWLGYIGTFGLLCLPLIVGSIREKRQTALSLALSLILGINLLDLIPNSSLTPITWLVAGSVIPVWRVRYQRQNADLMRRELSNFSS